MLRVPVYRWKKTWEVGKFGAWNHQGITMSIDINVINKITLYLFNIATENDPFIDGLPIKNGDIPWLC